MAQKSLDVETRWQLCTSYRYRPFRRRSTGRRSDSYDLMTSFVQEIKPLGIFATGWRCRRDSPRDDETRILYAASVVSLADVERRWQTIEDTTRYPQMKSPQQKLQGFSSVKTSVRISFGHTLNVYAC